MDHLEVYYRSDRPEALEFTPSLRASLYVCEAARASPDVIDQSERILVRRSDTYHSPVQDLCAGQQQGLPQE